MLKQAYGEKDDTCHLNAENEQKLESQPVAQNKGTTFINHPYQDGETAEMNPTNGIEVWGIDTHLKSQMLYKKYPTPYQSHGQNAVFQLKN